MNLDLKYVISVLLSVIVICAVLIPIVHSVTTEQETISNEGGVGAELSLYESGDDVDSTVTVAKSGSDYVLSGDYSMNIGSSDMVIMLANDQSLFVINGVMKYYDGSTTSEVDSYTLTLDSAELNGAAYEWVYFPETDGEYQSFPDGFEHNWSESVVGVGNFAGLTLISKDSVITSDNPYNMIATTQTEGDTVVGITYDVE